MSEKGKGSLTVSADDAAAAAMVAPSRDARKTQEAAGILAQGLYSSAASSTSTFSSGAASSSSSSSSSSSTTSSSSSSSSSASALASAARGGRDATAAPSKGSLGSRSASGRKRNAVEAGLESRSQESEEATSTSANDNLTAPKNGKQTPPKSVDKSRKKPCAPRRWTKAEDTVLKNLVQEYHQKEWKSVSVRMVEAGFDRSAVQCLHRYNKCLKTGLIKGPWTDEEDMALLTIVMHTGVANCHWSKVAKEIPGRLGKQCRERYYNHLDPTLNKGKWSVEEDNLLLKLVDTRGTKWAELAKLIPGRSANMLKNRYYLAKRKAKKHDNNLSRSLQSINTGSRTGAQKKKRKKIMPNGDLETIEEVADEANLARTRISGSVVKSEGAAAEKAPEAKEGDKGKGKGKEKVGAPMEFAI